MDVVRIRGGRPLAGEITVSGAKNASLPMLAATLLTGEPCVLRNVPALSDTRYMLEILRRQGAKTRDLGGGAWEITAGDIRAETPYELVRKMRASICLLGPLVGRLRAADIAQPGGCVIGDRPFDLHLAGLRRLGCVVTQKGGRLSVDGARLRGDYIFLGGRHGSTVTGTANIVMAAVLAKGETRLDCAACEPEIAALCRMLVAMGADISGIGGPMLTIRGVEKLHGCDFAVPPDRIEAGTYLLAGVITGGDVTVRGAIREHLGAVLSKFEECGVTVDDAGEGALRVRGEPARCSPVDIVTMPHPGFPTDLQAQFSALMAVTPGISLVTERIYPNRFMHVQELRRMGADIAIEGATAIIKDVRHLSGAPVMASDLRASAALILAGLAARGETWVQRIYHLDRGYVEFDKKLAALGADIERLDDSAMPGDCNREE
ncbi:MAG: UDP-N-acetylglucosamine 1-carboxyvinyltransferase [Puniceicoccales bacterium]|jgi:UDP-N-acetylglucosamine 1-carboxyvinyltransferase|nr:UDP-N-acetylglucosamine 1-carboxyvinyltransferase [Puniceicoccales bacterium]